MPTYFSHNGNSAIDLIFTNLPRKTSKLKVLLTVTRKHQKVTFSIFENINKASRIKKRLPKNLDQNTFSNNITKSHIRYTIFSDNLTNCMQTITNTITKSVVKQNFYKSKHKKWFDNDCKLLKRKCIEGLANKDPNYNKIKKEFKSLITSKKRNFLENQLHEKFSSETIQWEFYKTKVKVESYIPMINLK